MNLPGNSAGVSALPSSKKQIQLQGPRPPPLRVSKESQTIKKQPLPPHAAAAQQPPRPAPDDAGQQRQAVIIYSASTKVIHASVNDFMDIVQRLTRRHFCNEQTSGSGAISPAAKLASIEKTSPSEKERLRSAGNDAMTELEGVEVGQFPGMLSPTPANLGSVPPGLGFIIPDHLLTDDHEAMDILIQDHSNDKHVQLPEDTDAILHSLNTPTPFFIRKSGLGLTEPPKDEAWHNVVRVELANNKLSELPLSPSSPELEVLVLQGNVELMRIPNTFFRKMPLLWILDLSYTSVRELPDSLFELEHLREMYLKGCECFMKLSPKIGKLKKLKKLDLDGTQIIHLPEEIQELTNLQSLFLCFYEYWGKKGKQYTCSTIIPSEVL